MHTRVSAAAVGTPLGWPTRAIPAFLFSIGPFATAPPSLDGAAAPAHRAVGPDLTQLTGGFHAGAIIALADEPVTAAAMWETNPAGELSPELFPLTVHMSANVITTDRGTLVAKAEIVHRDRTTRVVDARVTDHRPPRGR